jgi:ribonuclease HII
MRQFFSCKTELDKFDVGCDEAGRGCLAGPVVAAAVVLPKNFFHPLLNDSKKLHESQRKFLRELIEKEALSFSVGLVDHQEIDQINILRASFLAMHRALDQLSFEPDIIIVDGNRFEPYKTIPHKCIVRGDATYMSIAAASIIAKTYRDDYMMKLHELFPEYRWNKNKGYPTKEHRDAIYRLGATGYHRKSFKLLATNQVNIFD